MSEDTTFWFYLQRIQGGAQGGTDLGWYIGERSLRNVLAEIWRMSMYWYNEEKIKIF